MRAPHIGENQSIEHHERHHRHPEHQLHGVPEQHYGSCKSSHHTLLAAEKRGAENL